MCACREVKKKESEDVVSVDGPKSKKSKMEEDTITVKEVSHISSEDWTFGKVDLFSVDVYLLLTSPSSGCRLEQEASQVFSTYSSHVLSDSL